MQPWQSQSLISLAVAAFIVIRFVRRELRPRIVRKRSLWIRPAVLFAVFAFVAVETLRIAPQSAPLLAFAVAAGACCGALTGAFVVRSTTFSSAGMPGAVRVHGSRATAAAWIGALALRLLARFFVPHGGLGVQYALNSGLLALVAAAFAIVAVAFHRAIDRSALPNGAPYAASSAISMRPASTARRKRS